MEEELSCAWDVDATTEHLFDAGTFLMSRISSGIHQVADSGLLEAGGIQDADLQRVCWCLFMGIQNVVRATIACVADRPQIANIQKFPATSRFHLCEAAQYIMINMRDALHHLARSGILEGAGMESKDIQAFCQALFCSVHAAVYNTAKLYEHC
jgi:hypothetical protein